MSLCEQFKKAFYGNPEVYDIVDCGNNTITWTFSSRYPAGCVAYMSPIGKVFDWYEADIEENVRSLDVDDATVYTTINDYIVGVQEAVVSNFPHLQE